MISRRSFLFGSTAIGVLPLLPVASSAAVVSVPSAPPLFAYAVGTPGEFDWHAIFARTPEDAFRTWVIDYLGLEEDDVDAPVFDPEFVNRVEEWDALKTVRPADWLDANLGHCCERCGYESHPETGARVVAGEVVCDECLTLEDRAAIDPADVVEDLANRIADEGEEEVREWLESRNEMRHVAGDLWDRACIEARAET